MKGNGKRKGKTPNKTAKPALVPQPNGRGAIYAGGVPGNVGGTGRPPSVIRERCRGSFDQRIPTLEQIADGEPIQKMRMADGEKTEITISASPSDRIKAIDALGKYGLTAGRVDQEEVRTRLARTVQKIMELANEETAEAILKALDRIWDPNQDESAA
jgi:hypothetical protein